MPVFDISEVDLVEPQNSASQPSPPKDSGTGNDVDMDAAHKDIEDKLAKKKEVQDRNQANADPNFRPATGSGKAGSPGTGGGIGDLKTDKPVFGQPTFNWKRLVQNMIPSSAPKPDLSYAKPSSSSATIAHIASQRGAAAMKPGTKLMDVDTRKLALVFDISGSMHESNTNAMKEIPKLLKNKDFDNSPIGVIFFASDVKMFTVNIRQNYYAKVETMADLSKTPPVPGQKKGYLNLFNMQEGGGTVFGSHVMAEIQNLINQGYNVIMFSDADVTVGQNWENFLALVTKNKHHISFIANNEATWRTICEQMKHAPTNFGYLD
jgi:hypothetical protein